MNIANCPRVEEILRDEILDECEGSFEDNLRQMCDGYGWTVEDLARFEATLQTLSEDEFKKYKDRGAVDLSDEYPETPLGRATVFFTSAFDWATS